MEKTWEELSKEERQEERFNRWLSPEGVQFDNREAEVAYKARITRLKDAVQLKKAPDRVPVFPFHTFMPLDLYDVTPEEVKRLTRELRPERLCFGSQA